MERQNECTVAAQLSAAIPKKRRAEKERDENLAAVAVGMGRAAELIGTSRVNLYRLMKANRGPPSLLMGKRRLIRIDALKAWLLDLEGAQSRKVAQ